MITLLLFLGLALSSKLPGNEASFMTTNWRGVQVAPGAAAENIEALLNEDINIIRYQVTQPGEAPNSWDSNTWKNWVRGHLDYVDYLSAEIIQGKFRVVLDLHTPPGGFTGTKAAMFVDKPWAKNTLIEMWEEIAQRYQWSSNIYAFDIANELAGSVAEVNNIMERAVKTIRATESDTICIVSSPYGDPIKIKTVKVLPFKRIWYSIHYYKPMSFTHQGIAGRPTGKLYPTERNNKDIMYDNLVEARKFQLKHKVPIYVGEYSASGLAPLTSRTRYLRDLMSIFEEYGFQYTYHAWREADIWNAESTPKVIELLRSFWKKN